MAWTHTGVLLAGRLDASQFLKKPYGESLDTSWCISCAFRGHIWTCSGSLFCRNDELHVILQAQEHWHQDALKTHIYVQTVCTDTSRQTSSFRLLHHLSSPSPVPHIISHSVFFFFVFLFKLNLKTFLGRACVRRFKVQLWTLILERQFTDSADYKSFNCEL